MRSVVGMLALATALTMVGRLWADETCPASKPGHHEHHAMGFCHMLKGLSLSDDQKAKLKALKEEYKPKFKAAADSILTADQQKARDEAVKAAKAEGKKGPEVWKAARHAVKLTDEQKAKFHEAMKPLHKELHEKVMALLTTEQKEQLKHKCAAGEAHHHDHAGMHCHFLKGLNLTDDQKAKLKELHKEFHEKFLAILTPEQQSQLKEKCEHHKACDKK